MKYRRMPIEVESPEELGYSTIKYNLAESSVSDIDFSAIKIPSKTILGYGSHYGRDELRKLIANEYNSGPVDEVLVTQGAAAALFIIHTSLLNSGDEIVVMHPNYSTNLETPYAIGCRIKRVALRFENKFKLNANDVIGSISSKTKLVSLTNPHNPTGKVFNSSELEAIISFCGKRKINVLIDETYSHIPFPGYKHVVLEPRKNLIRVSSLSKAYGVPGIRIGWINCSDKKLMQKFLAAKEQMVICNSVLDEAVAIEVLKQKTKTLNKAITQINTNFEYLKKWLGRQYVLDYVLPDAGVVMLPRLKREIDTKQFYKSLLIEHKSYVGAGHWFGLSDRFFRLGFGWASGNDIKKGLAAIEKAASPFL